MKKNLKLARKLRHNMTEAEKVLWYKLRNKQLGTKFRRQEPLGDYIVDFVCFEHKLIIEVDGGQHSENEQDVVRDQWFEKRGYKVLRFWNNDVLENIDGILKLVRKEVSPSSSSSPFKGEEK